MRPAAALALLVTLATLGCGGEEGPSRAEYQAKANAICAAARSRTAPLVEQLSAAAGSLTAARAAEAAAAARRLETLAGRSVAQLRALEQPSGDTEEIERFVGAGERLVAAVGRAAQALRDRDVIRALGVVQQSRGLGREAEAAAAAYGLDQCERFLALTSR
jgi:hypothetical protein